MDLREAHRILDLPFGHSYTAKEVATAFRRMSLSYHPDKRGGSAEAFKLLNEAVDVLKRDFDIQGLKILDALIFSKPSKIPCWADEEDEDFIE
jgi:hypothetical protein